VKTSGQTFPVQQSDDRVLEDGKESHEEGEYNRFMQGGKNQRLVFELPTQAQSIAEQNDLGHDQCFDHRSPVMQISDVVLGEY